MSAGILKGVDRGIVGMVERFGGTWHGLAEYLQINGAVAFEDAMRCLDYKVSKVPLSLMIPADMLSLFPEGTQGKAAITPADPDKATSKGSPLFALVRQDNGQILHRGAVLNDFTVYQNADFLNEVERGLLSRYPELKIESCGSLFGGRIAFLNLLLEELAVNKDNSKTLVRLAMFNAFGGKSIWAGMHSTRIVCQNTARMAEAQSAANKTLRKFSHTSGAPQRVEKHLSEIAELKAVTAKHVEMLNMLADIPMVTADVTNYLGTIFPITSEMSGKAETGRGNKQDAIRELFETEPDLQGAIKHTRYAMYQATTQYINHKTLTKGTDQQGAWYEIVTGGARHKFQQTALDVLTKAEIPDPKAVALLTAGNGDDDNVSMN